MLDDICSLPSHLHLLHFCIIAAFAIIIIIIIIGNVRELVGEGCVNIEAQHLSNVGIATATNDPVTYAKVPSFKLWHNRIVVVTVAAVVVVVIIQ